MAVSKEQVLAALEGVRSPEGTPLPRSGTLSEVVKLALVERACR